MLRGSPASPVLGMAQPSVPLLCVSGRPCAGCAAVLLLQTATERLMHMKKLGREEQTSRCVLSLRPQVPTLHVGQGFREAHVLWWVCLRVWVVTIPSGLWPGSCGILRAACPPLGEGGLAQSPEAGFCGLELMLCHITAR